MPSAANSWLLPAAIGVGLITALRVVLLAFNQTDLFVDEAQYWLWGQRLEFGYYSKPPLIGWVIRLATEIGSDAPFWVRLPAPLLHGATALILGAIAARLFDGRAAVVVALGYVTLPMVAVASLLISTDTVMFPFLAASLLFYLRLQEAPRFGTAILCGLCLGGAFMGKYAAIYYVLCALLALPLIRPRPGHALAILGAFLLAVSGNIAWNIANGLTTVQHTMDNADWVRDPGARAGLNWDHLAEFFFAQFAVFGPVLMGALLWLALRWRRRAAPERVLLIFALPIVALVCLQALLSEAYANWAAAAYLAGAVLVLAKLPRPWLIASFLINGSISLLLPLAATAPELLARDGQPLLNRYIGRAEMTQAILSRAEAEGLGTIVAGDRDILADLFYAGRDHPAQVFAIPPAGRPPHHYAQRYPYQGGAGPVLLVLRASTPVPCGAAARIETIAPETGAYRRHPMVLYRAPGACIGGVVGSTHPTGGSERPAQ